MEIPLKPNTINIVADFHTAFLSLQQIPTALVISIRPPNLLRERYGIEDSVWLTYLLRDYNNAISPDRIEFELMEKIVYYVNNGGKTILLDGIE